MAPPNRRDVLRAGTALAATSLLPACGQSGAPGVNDGAGPEPDAVGFIHGVASGDPLSDRVMLWTRITPEAGDQPVTVTWAVYEDADLTVSVTGGDVVTDAARDFTVKVDATGLQPGRHYWFLFTAGEVTSPVGRARTLPTGSPERVRLGVATCGDYSRGLWNAYARLAERDDIDLFLHLGDYIYETDRDAVRAHQPPIDVVTVDDYRARYASYRREPELQALHAAHPMIWVWDDHETVDGTWSGGADPNDHDPEIHGPIEVRQANALQAAMEWLPIRPPDPANPERIYRDFAFGDLIDLFMLDTRRIGRDEVLPGNLGVGDFFTQTGDFVDPQRQMLGAEQEQWLIDGLQTSSARWRLLGNQVVLSPLKLFGAPAATGASIFANPDQWDGYEPARNRLFDAIEQGGVDNIVVLTGDVHASIVFEVTRDPNNPLVYDPLTGRGVLATEFVAPSISSAGDPQTLGPDTSTGDLEDILLARGGGALLAINIHGKYYEGTRNGYLVVDVDRERTQVEYWTVPTVTAVTDEQSLDATFVVTAGDGRIRRLEAS
ncbi:alkaline phosphatase D family protein [uncultured Abyssibacter sp.]|uniref:alkaline phosphatase D family protein n=1 Tax=uncultured Abyssibacter sp. TaxID=2320202 RepID=UPI0032B18FAC